MSGAARKVLSNGWKAFGMIGTGVGLADQYHQGYQGKPFGWTDIGPQAIPKFAGRLHHGHNMEQQMKGKWEMEKTRAKLVQETPPFQTNYPNRPIIKY
ncbi:MAG TPA: hypothetical protein VM553_08545 [Dongiaceae bacterium]|nr:hypothetical protein [Dongiaceae bacterium]